MSSLLCWLLVACGGPTPTADADTISDTGSEAPVYSISGRVLDLDDTPVVEVFVTVSSEFCVPDRTDDGGAFMVTEVDAGPKRLITYGETADSGLYASIVVAFDAAGDTDFPNPFYTPALTQIFPLDPDAADPKVFTSAEGIELTIPPGAVDIAPFAPDELQIARVPLDKAADFVPDGFELVDLVVLHPIQSTIDPPASLTLPADTGLAPGTTVRFLALDYDTGLLTPVADGTVDASGHPHTNDGEGIPELTWVGLALDTQ